MVSLDREPVLLLPHCESQLTQSSFMMSVSRQVSWILFSLLLGVDVSFLFRWNQRVVYPDISMLDIALHNISLSIILILLGSCACGIIYCLNACYFGICYAASIQISGFYTTASLTVGHVPLEITAWVISWSAARVLERWREEALLSGYRFVRMMLWTVLLFSLAAIVEYEELHWFLAKVVC